MYKPSWSCLLCHPYIPHSEFFIYLYILCIIKCFPITFVVELTLGSANWGVFFAICFAYCFRCQVPGILWERLLKMMALVPKDYSKEWMQLWEGMVSLTLCTLGHTIIWSCYSYLQRYKYACKCMIYMLLCVWQHTCTCTCAEHIFVYSSLGLIAWGHFATTTKEQILSTTPGVLSPS